MKSDTCQNIWQTKNYYKTIASLEDFSHPGFKRAVELSKEATKILDVGWGDGSKLAKLGGIRSARAGVEISSMAVEVSRKKLPQIKFIHQTNDRLPFTENIFDIVTSFFVLEHTQNPDKMISEMIRVAKNGGLIIWLAPNFGAPNRASPNFTGSRPMKLITGIVNDLQNNNYLNKRFSTRSGHHRRTLLRQSCFICKKIRRDSGSKFFLGYGITTSEDIPENYSYTWKQGNLPL